MQIFVPGRGLLDTRVAAVDRAVRAYDERLMFDRNKETNQWTVFISQSSSFEWEGMHSFYGTNYFPILSFPEVPDPEHAVERLRDTDTLRNGLKILDQLHRHNKNIKEEIEYKASEAAGIVAEAQESYMHGTGQTRYHRSLPKNPKVKKEVV